MLFRSRRFPLIGAAMASGQLSYSKARAITRIATDDNEAALTMWALAGTSNQVERIVSAYSRSARVERGRNEQQWAGRALHHRTDDDGSIVITLRLPADAGVEFLSAVEQFVAPSAPLDDGTREPLSARRADAAVHMARVAHATAHAPAHATTGAAPPLVTLHVDLDALCSDTGTEPDTDTEAPRTCHIDGAPSATPHPHAVSPATALRLLCGADLEALLQQAEHAVGVTDRTALVRGRLRHHILLRDGTCRYPDCGRAAALDIHHIIHRHHGGSNHTSNLDTPAIYAALPRVWRRRLAPAMRENYFDNKPFQYFFAGLLFNGFLLPQEFTGVCNAIRHIEYLVSRRFCPLIFPEGRITTDGALQDFRPGVGLLAVRLHLPVVPIYIHGLFDIFPPNAKWPRGGRVQVVIGKPIKTGANETYIETTAAIRNSIQSEAVRLTA